MGDVCTLYETTRIAIRLSFLRTQDSFVSEMKEEGKMKKLSIHLKEVSIHFSGKPILEIDELFVYENEKIGIIGKTAQENQHCSI